MKLRFGFPSSRAGGENPAICRRRRLLARRNSLLLAVIGIAVLPLAWRGPSCGQDFDFHLQNWLELVQSWRQGLFDPHWAASANYGAGEPRFVFYPPLARFLGAALGLLLPWSWTLLAFALAALLGAGFAMRAMAREWLSDDSATLAACLYVVNPYMLFVLYDRGALAELLAATWIPLLVLFALRKKPSLIPLALTFAALWLTNAPAAVMGSYALLLLVIPAAMRQRSWALPARSAAAVPLGLALAGFWLVPAIRQQRWVRIDRATGPLMRVEDSFLFGFVPLPTASPEERFDTLYHNHVLRTASWIAVALIAAAVVSAAWFHGAGLRKNSRPSRSEPEQLPHRTGAAASAIAAAEGFWFSGPAIPLAILGLFIVLLQIPASDILWRVIPELHFLQFPWRWLLVLGIVASLFVAAASPPVATRRALARRAVVVLLLACGLSAWAAWSLWQPCDDEDNIAAQRAAFRTTGFEGTDEYTLRGVDEGPLAGLAPGSPGSGGPVVAVIAGPPGPSQATLPAAVETQRWASEHGSVVITVHRAGFAILRLTAYPAWRVLVNGVEVDHPGHRSDGLLVIPVASGRNRIEIRWRTTPDQAIGIALSLFAVAVTLALAFAARRNAQKVPLP